MAKKYVYLFCESIGSGRSNYYLQIKQLIASTARSKFDQIIEPAEELAVCDCTVSERSTYDAKEIIEDIIEEFEKLVPDFLRDIVMLEAETAFNQTIPDAVVLGRENELFCYFYPEKRSKRIILMRQLEGVRERHRWDFHSCSLKIA